MAHFDFAAATPKHMEFLSRLHRELIHMTDWEFYEQMVPTAPLWRLLITTRGAGHNNVATESAAESAPKATPTEYKNMHAVNRLIQKNHGADTAAAMRTLDKYTRCKARLYSGKCAKIK